MSNFDKFFSKIGEKIPNNDLQYSIDLLVNNLTSELIDIKRERDFYFHINEDTCEEILDKSRFLGFREGEINEWDNMEYCPLATIPIEEVIENFKIWTKKGGYMRSSYIDVILGINIFKVIFETKIKEGVDEIVAIETADDFTKYAIASPFLEDLSRNMVEIINDGASFKKLILSLGNLVTIISHGPSLNGFGNYPKYLKFIGLLVVFFSLCDALVDSNEENKLNMLKIDNYYNLILSCFGVVNFQEKDKYLRIMISESLFNNYKTTTKLNILKGILSTCGLIPSKFSVLKIEIQNFVKRLMIKFASYRRHRIFNKSYHNKEEREGLLETAFITWIQQGKIDLIKRMVKNTNGKIGNYPYGKFKASPLIMACVEGNLDIIKLFVENGADINFQDINGGTPLMHACIIGNIKVVKYLLENGADPEIKDNRGGIAIHGALSKGHKDIISLFEQKFGVKYVVE